MTLPSKSGSQEPLVYTNEMTPTEGLLADLKGLKRICMSCGARFYDLNKKPIICPTCNVEFTGEIKVKSRRGRLPAEMAEAQVDEAEPEVVEVETEEVESDEETVSLDELDEDSDDDGEDIELDADIDIDDLDDDDLDDDDIDEDIAEEEDDK